MSEWLKEHAWKVCMRETVSRVRIPLSLPFIPGFFWKPPNRAGLGAFVFLG